jgi:hypothetical protein
LLERAAALFGAEQAAIDEPKTDLKALHAKIGQQALEIDLLRDLLNRRGHAIGHKHVATLMRKMGIEALYRKPNTSKSTLSTRSSRTCCAS